MFRVCGTVETILPANKWIANGKKWINQEYIIRYMINGYKNRLVFTLTGDKIAKFALKRGDEITALLGINCKEVGGRVYNHITAYAVFRTASGEYNDAVKNNPLGDDGHDTPVPNPVDPDDLSDMPF